ncbi:hypothetical protein ScPMuIL_004220 [Solemya velum]
MKLLTIGVVVVVVCGVCVCDNTSAKPKYAKKLKQHCHYENATYHAGQKFKPNACTSCRCSRHLRRVVCSVMDCIWNPNCIKYEKKKGVCCPKCLEYGCLHKDNKAYRLGSVVSVNKCEKCYCPKSGGRTECERLNNCPRPPCVDPHIPKGKCCPKCPNGPSCRAFSQVIRAGIEVVINGYRCKCPRKKAMWRGSLDANCFKD